jgi:hypothetical protein
VSSDHPNGRSTTRARTFNRPVLTEPLEPRTLLSVDFTLSAFLALTSHGFSHLDSPALDLFRNAHQPKIKFDPAITEALNEAEEDPPEIDFDPGVVPGPNAPVLAGTIEAINFDDDASNTGFYQIPPDANGAAGLNHVVNVVNSTIQWYTKAGSLQNTQRLGKNGSTAVGSLFAAQNPLTGTFDPRVVYDQYNGRFVVIADEMTNTADGDPANTSRLLIAVSDDSDPNGTWFTTAINTKVTIPNNPFPSVDTWMDYPTLAIDANAIYVTGNMFAFSGAPFNNKKSSFGGSRLWIISKSGLYTGSSPTSANIYDPSAAASVGAENFTMQPTMMYGPAPGSTGTFLVSSGWVDGSSNDYLSVIRVSNPLASPTFSNTFVNLGNIHQDSVAFPSAVSQSGTTKTINADDSRMYSAMWRNNTIWAANTVNPPSGSADSGTATAHWYKISADSANIGATPADQGNISGEDIATGTRTFYPAITVDSLNNMGIGFSASGPNIFPGAYYTGRLSTDAAGTVQPAAALAAGQAFYFRTFSPSGGVSRWGDYSSIALDPSDSTTFWLYNEYALPRGTILSGLPNEDGRWGTRFGKFSLGFSAAPAAPDLLAATDTGTSSSDNKTNRDNSSAGKNLQFSVGGTVSGATVTVFADGNAIGSAIAAGATTNVTTSGALDLTDGTHAITAKQTEVGKNPSSASAALSITIDTAAPTVTASSYQFETAPNQLSYTFSEDVSPTLSTADVSVVSVPAGTTPALSAPTWNAATNTATFNFASTPLPNNNYQATLAAAGVTDLAGNGLAASNVLPFFALAGDGDRNKQVNIQDFNTLAISFGTTGKTFSQGNYDYSPGGTVDILDFNVLATNFGATLP